MVVPKELKAWVRFNLLEAVSGGPKTATYGFAATCKAVIPAAKIIKAPRKSGNEAVLAAGMKSSAPTPMVKRPVTMVFLYPMASTSFAEGMEKIK